LQQTHTGRPAAIKTNITRGKIYCRKPVCPQKLHALKSLNALRVAAPKSVSLQKSPLPFAEGFSLKRFSSVLCIRVFFPIIAQAKVRQTISQTHKRQSHVSERASPDMLGFVFVCFVERLTCWERDTLLTLTIIIFDCHLTFSGGILLLTSCDKWAYLII
jgi:hypothetical protein